MTDVPLPPTQAVARHAKRAVLGAFAATQARRKLTAAETAFFAKGAIEAVIEILWRAASPDLPARVFERRLIDLVREAVRKETRR